MYVVVGYVIVKHGIRVWGPSVYLCICGERICTGNVRVGV